MIDSRVLFSLVPMVGEAFWAFGTASKGLEWQQVTRYKHGCTSLVMECCGIFSNILDFAVYVHTMAHYMPSHHLWWLDKPLPLPISFKKHKSMSFVDREIFVTWPESSCSPVAVSMPCHGTSSVLQASISTQWALPNTFCFVSTGDRGSFGGLLPTEGLCKPQRLWHQE